MNEIRIVLEPGEARTEEKKSKFIAAVSPVSAEEEALSAIAAARKKYWDASHNCWAYIIGENPGTARCSDDGEPQGTAGRPILEVMQGRHLQNALIIVTRYFGGTLLGTGGLVRAYSSAASAGIDAAVTALRRDGFLTQITADYTDAGKVQYILGKLSVHVLDSIYDTCVRYSVLADEAKTQMMIKEITEATGARAKAESMRPVRFADGENPVILEEY